MSAILDALLAPRCAGCDAPGAWFCIACRDLCEPVRRGRLHAAASYGGPIARAVHRFKYRGERALANELGALVASCVARDLAAAPQAMLDRSRRLQNVRGAFISEAGALHGLRVTLVDDVVTTGATLAAASSALRAAGAREVRWYVVAVDE